MADPRWLTNGKERIADSEPIRVGSDIHLLEMAIEAYEQARAENARLREAAARLEMVKRWLDGRHGRIVRLDLAVYNELIPIVDGTTPIPDDMKGEPK